MNGGSNLCQQKLITHTKKSEKESLIHYRSSILWEQRRRGNRFKTGL
jgi:hypothetical protein